MRMCMIWLLFVLLGLVACSESENHVVARYDDVGFQYSPTALQGVIEYAPPLVPEYVRIVRVDSVLNSRDSIEIILDSTFKNSFVFKIAERDYEFPYVKIVGVFSDGKKKVEFPQYLDLRESNNDLKLNLNASLAAGRIETLVQKEGLDFSAAEEKAYSEMTEIFKADFNAWNTYRFKDVHYANRWELYEPYLYCRHEISDSVFYSDYKEMSEYFAKTGKVDSSLIVRAADAWLSTFAPAKDKNGRPTYKSFSRDTSFVSYAYYGRVFERIYGLTMPACNSYNHQVTIENKRSEFYGRKFACPCEYDNWASICFYRLVDPIEDTLGLCLLQTTTVAEYNNAYYVCKEKDNVWKAESEIDTVLKYKFGACGNSETKNQFFYLNDSLFFCECDGDNCSWTDRFVNKDINEEDSLYAAVLNARGVQKFGKCQTNNSYSGDKYPLDSVFVQCQYGKWGRIDSLTYYLGGCSRDKAEHLGVYYSCEGSLYHERFLTWQNIWKEIPAPVYYGEECYYIHFGEVVEHDGFSFVCEATDACKNEDGVVVPEIRFDPGCDYYWQKQDK